MAKAKKSSRKKSGAVRHDQIMECSATSVIRKLAAVGASNKEIKQILVAKGVKMSGHSVDVQCGFGRAKVEGRPLADLSKEQVKELRALASKDEETVAATA